MNPTYYTQHDGAVVALDPPARRALTLAFYALTGVSMAPLLAKAALFVPAAIPIAGALTGFIVVNLVCLQDSHNYGWYGFVCHVSTSWCFDEVEWSIVCSSSWSHWSGYFVYLC